MTLHAYILIWPFNKMHFTGESLQYINTLMHHLELACKMVRIGLHAMKRINA
jgi:hypothetical protein